MIKNFFNKKPLAAVILLWVAAGVLIGVFLEPYKLIDSIFPDYTLAADKINEPLKQLDISAQHEIYQSQDITLEDKEQIITYNNISEIKSFDMIAKSLYNIDETAYVYDDELDFDKLLAVGTKADLYGEEPKVLIFHTHSQEAFADSRPGETDDTIVGVGAYLAQILREYGVSVIHHTGIYDMVDGKVVRGGSYEAMEAGVRKVLEEYPSIEVMIDLHRDSLPSNRRIVTEIDGRPTAQIMFFNGICRLNEGGEPVPTTGLNNEYITENLALSLRTKLLANEMYPDFTRKNYIKPYRYSLHMRPLSLLIEVGSDTSTVEEAKNAMLPLAEILVKAFS